MSEWLYYVVDRLGYIISAHETRNEAVAAKARYHDCNGHEIIPVRPVMALWKTPKHNRNAPFHGVDLCGDERKVKA